MTGMRQSAREYIDAVCDGTLNYYSAEHEGIEVEVAPDGSSWSRARRRTEAARLGGSAGRPGRVQALT